MVELIESRRRTKVYRLAYSTYIGDDAEAFRTTTTQDEEEGGLVSQLFDILLAQLSFFMARYSGITMEYLNL